MKTYSQFIAESTDGFYAFRTLSDQSAKFLSGWMREHNIPNPIPADKLHVTVVCSENSIPTYTPDPTMLQINPATFKVDMMDEALVIKFKSDPLVEQWQQAMNLGVKSRYPRFTPHISLSYKVPLDYDYTNLKPPPTFLVFNEEQIRPLALQEFTGDIISDNPEIYVPQNHLNVSRDELPQIADRHKMAFVDWLEEKGIVVQYVGVPVAVLRSVQDEINLKKVQQLMDNPVMKPIVISKENFVIDGHHRWIAALNHDPHQIIDAYRINLPVNELLTVLSNYRQTHST